MNLNELSGVATVPFVTPSGEVVTRSGYHPDTGVFLALPTGHEPNIPTTPTREDLIEALGAVWRPGVGYRFATDNDRGAMLATILGAVCRPALPIAPATILDAPVQGSGKTLAAEAVAAVVRGCRGVAPWVSGGNTEAEMTKRLVSLCLEGRQALVLDNIKGFFDSNVLAAFLTSGRIEGERILGGNSTFSGEARVALLATSNNASLSRDLGRRFLRVRIDTGTETPQALTYGFDPVERALAERLSIAAGLCTLLVGFHGAGAPVMGRGEVGFPAWSRTVRACVLWLQREGLTEDAGIGAVGDPGAGLLEDAGTDDPDQIATGDLLHGLRGVFGGEPFTSNDVASLWKDRASEAIAEALAEFLSPGKRDHTSTTIGRVLANRKDRIIGGLVLRACGQDRTGKKVWAVAEN